MPLISSIGWSTIHDAAFIGNIKIIKFLAPLLDDPNIRDITGDTAIDVARKDGHNEVVKFLQSYKNLLNVPD